MAKAAARVQIKLKSSESHYCYYTMKNKRNTPDRLELKKYDPVLRRRVNFKEEK
jgi:large subunit ribosomal protein L33